MTTIAFIAAGYADFALIALHFKKAGLAPGTWIPLLYAMVIATDAVAVPALGRAFDRIGLWAMAAAMLASATTAPLVFLGNLPIVAVGMVLWGIGSIIDVFTAISGSDGRLLVCSMAGEFVMFGH